MFQDAAQTKLLNLGPVIFYCPQTSWCLAWWHRSSRCWRDVLYHQAPARVVCCEHLLDALPLFQLWKVPNWMKEPEGISAIHNTKLLAGITAYSERDQNNTLLISPCRDHYSFLFGRPLLACWSPWRSPGVKRRGFRFSTPPWNP